MSTMSVKNCDVGALIWMLHCSNPRRLFPATSFGYIHLTSGREPSVVTGGAHCP